MAAESTGKEHAKSRGEHKISELDKKNIDMNTSDRINCEMEDRGQVNSSAAQIMHMINTLQAQQTDRKAEALTVGAKAAAEPARARTAVALASIVGRFVGLRRGAWPEFMGCGSGKVNFRIKSENRHGGSPR
jgi:hypothetical protein